MQRRRSNVKYTNKYNLPDVVVRAVTNDPYSKGKSDFSATELIKPARQRALFIKHQNDITKDVSEMSYTLIGNNCHYIAERAERLGIDLCEERFFSTFIVDGKEFVVSAQIDIFETDTQTLIDWKTSKAYAVGKKTGYGQKPEWIAQLNIGAEI